jgi:hypothetical protein
MVDAIWIHTRQEDLVSLVGLSDLPLSSVKMYWQATSRSRSCLLRAY